MIRPFRYTIIHKFKVAFLPTAKVGSTTLLALALNYDFPEIKYNTSSPRAFVHNNPKYNNGKIKVMQVPEDYRCYMFVRNPYDRVWASLQQQRYCRKIEEFAQGDALRLFLRIKAVCDDHFQFFEYSLKHARDDTKICRFEEFNETIKNIFQTENIPHFNRRLQYVNYKDAYNEENKLIVGDVYSKDIRSLNYTFDSYGPLPTLKEIRKSYA